MEPRSRSRLVIRVGLFVCLLLASFTYGVIAARQRHRPAKVTIDVLTRVAKLMPGSSKGAASRPGGIWHKLRDSDEKAGLPSDQQTDIAAISALPYLQGYQAAPSVRNVTILEERAVQDGLNFVVSAHGPAAFLMDMQGNVLHEWRKDFRSAWPDPPKNFLAPEQYKTYWRRAHLLEDGGVLAIFMDIGLVRLDSESKLLWTYPSRAHHDLFVERPSGNIYVLTRELSTRPGLRLESWTDQTPVVEDFIVVLSPEGKELKKVSVLDCFLNSDFAALLEQTRDKNDIIHTNSLRPVLSDGHPLFKRGQLIVSFRDIHTIAALDMEQQKITWTASGLWKFQHDPRLLANGNVLLFDNRGNAGKSKAIEFDPLTKRVAWTYRGEPAEKFYSREAGTLERLTNGNTLLIESEAGRAFEVTPAGKIVWEFYNPHRTGEQQELIAALYDVVRLDRGCCGWLKPETRTAAR